MSATFYDAASPLALQGRPVFPLKPDKKPLTPHGFKDATTDVEQIKNWGERWPNALVGVPTGKVSDRFVLDVDVKNGNDGFNTLAAKGWRLPATRIHHTPNGGGRHYLLHYPKDQTLTISAGKLGAGLDTRGDGGYIVWWPAHGYAVENMSKLADVPDWLMTALLDADNKPPPSFDQPISEGKRNDTLFRLAAFLRAKGVAIEVIEAALMAENWTKCVPPLPEMEVRTIAQSTERYVAGGHEHPTDAGNARRLVQLFGEDIRYCHTLKKWLNWEGQRWVPDEDGKIMRLSKKTTDAIFAEAITAEDDGKRRAIVKHALQSENASRLQATIILASSENGIPIALGELDSDPMLMGVSNGVIDLRTGNLRDSRRDDYITKQTLVRYNPTAACPRWLSFLDQIMCGKQGLVDFLQRAIGYCMTGDFIEQCLFLLHGLGSNGKSTFLNVVKALMGDYGIQIAPEAIMLKHDGGVPNDIARLRGARFVATSETEDGKRLAEGLIKQLTGGDTVSARFLYGEYFEFIPQFKIWLAANHKPVIRGDDYAVWRRIRLIPFNATFNEQERDGKLSGKLMAELPGILNWALQGCLAWQREGLTPPAEVLEATKLYRNEMDIVQSWIDECCVLNVNAKAKASDLFENYKKWGEATRVYVMNQPKFLRKLVEHSFEKKHTTVQSVNGVFFKGLGLLVGEKDEIPVGEKEKY